MRIVPALLLAAATIPVGPAFSGTSQTQVADEAAIRTIVVEQVNAWNAGDAVAFSKSFAPQGSFTNIRGTVFYGHRAFEERHREIFTGFFKGSRLVMSVTRIRAIVIPNSLPRG